MSDATANLRRKSASAGDFQLLGNLHVKFHRLRQSGIDEVLFDVISGHEALADGASG